MLGEDECSLPNFMLSILKIHFSLLSSYFYKTILHRNENEQKIIMRTHLEQRFDWVLYHIWHHIHHSFYYLTPKQKRQKDWNMPILPLIFPPLSICLGCILYKKYFGDGKRKIKSYRIQRKRKRIQGKGI